MRTISAVKSRLLLVVTILLGLLKGGMGRVTATPLVDPKPVGSSASPSVTDMSMSLRCGSNLSFGQNGQLQRAVLLNADYETAPNAPRLSSDFDSPIEDYSGTDPEVRLQALDNSWHRHLGHFQAVQGCPTSCGGGGSCGTQCSGSCTPGPGCAACNNCGTNCNSCQCF